MANERGRRRGAMLVEFIVSFSILGLVLGVMVQLLPYAHLVNRRAWDIVTAQELASNRLQRTSGTAFDQIPPLSVDAETRRGTEFTCEVTSAPYDAAQTPVLLKRVTVTVTWHQSHRDESLQEQVLLARTFR